MTKQQRPDADPNAETVPSRSSAGNTPRPEAHQDLAREAQVADARSSDDRSSDDQHTEVLSDRARLSQPAQMQSRDADTGTFYSHDQRRAPGGSTQLETPPGSVNRAATPTPQPASSDHDVLALMAGLDRYSDLQLAGQGSFGAVLKAVDQVLGRQVAIKVLKRDPPAGFEVCFQSEARRLASLEHPGICKVFDFGTQEGRPYIVTEWLAGESLAKLNKPLDWKRACELVADVAEAMSYAHRQEVVHRDLKPANIMVDAHGKIRVIDFGLALDDSEQLQSREDYCGSPAYMSPEQVSGRLHLLDARVDVWAMGVILYELLTGNRPFRGHSSSDVLIKIRNKPAAPPRTFQPDIPAAVEKVVLQCLAKQPDDRIPTAADVARELRAILADAGVSAIPTIATSAGAVGNSGAAPRRSPLRRSLLWLAPFVACVGVIVLIVRLNSPPRTAPARIAPGPQAENSQLTSTATRPNNYLAVQGLRPATGQRWTIDAQHPKSPSIDTGDRVSLSIDLDQSRHIYLVWFGTDSGTTFLYPGPLGTVADIGNPTVDRPTQTLELPIGTITATPSTETVLLIAPLRPFASPDDLERLIISLPRPDLTRVVAAGMFRGIHFDAQQWQESDSDSPEVREALQNTVKYLQRELGSDTIIQAVSFASGAR